MQDDTLKARGWIESKAMRAEFDADLGDARRTQRARRAGVAVSMAPGLSFPKIFADEASLEGFYRLIENDDVSWRELVGAHATQAAQRAKSFQDILVVHDTTEVSFRTYWPDQIRDGLCALSKGRHGLYVHASLAVTGDGTVLPLGILNAQPFVHASDIAPDDTEKRQFWLDEGGLFESEAERWFQGVDESEQWLRSVGVRPIHVMDREGDSFGLLAWLLNENNRFVVRGQAFRKLQHDGPLQDLGVVAVQLGEVRPNTVPKKDQKAHPPRRSRIARLTIRSGVVSIPRGKGGPRACWAATTWENLPRAIQLNLVEAVETDPPPGEKPVRWLLLTTEPAETAEQALRVVDIYRRRWLIEEYFKALKSGCLLEQRQAETTPVLLRVLALLLPAAWRLLLLRRLADDQPDASWRALLTPLEFRVLRRVVPKAKLTEKATIDQCLLAIAKLGGHLPRNGRPGWQTLYTGWRRLEDLAEGARLVLR